MAEGKKSFLVYCDVYETVKHLTNEQAGELFKHMLAYVNDENPETNNAIIKIAFEPIKQSLKRDLKRYEGIREKRSKAGRASAEKRKQKQHMLTHVKSVQQTSTNPTVIDSVSVSVSDSVDTNVSSYSESEFFKDWNTLRFKHLKKPSHINSIGGYESKAKFKELKNSYSQEEFKNALVGLFKQKKLPNGNTTMQSNPRHFLTHFEPYLTAFYDKNDSLYGKIKETP